MSLLYITRAGDADPEHRWDPSRPTAILPGSFNPLHAGHVGLAAVAERLLELPVAFELSTANVDKPDLPMEEARRRAAQLAGRAPVWVTHAARFVEKAELFPGCAFVVGADTALRLVAPRYYEGDEARMRAALTRFGERGCRFLVACRRGADGRCLELRDTPVPAGFSHLFRPIPVELFRLDVSSTELRAASGAPASSGQ